MSPSLTFVAVSVLALSSTPALASSTDQSPNVEVAAPFQLNLARTFSSTVEQLKKRQSSGGSSLKVSRRSKERSISDELLSLLKLAGAGGHAYDPASPSQHTAAAVKPSAVWDPSRSEHTQAAAKPTGSRKPSNNGQHALAGKPYQKGGPSAAYNTHLASPTDHSKPKPHKPSSAYTHAAVAPSSHPTGTKDSSAKPSAAYHPDPEHTMAAVAPGVSQQATTGSEHVAKKRGLLEMVQKRIQEEPWENLDSQLLCPAGETACPIFPRMGTYECIDTSSELENCGGCSSRSLGEDCTTIKGALGLACQSGKCNVFTCQPGFEFEEMGRDGHGGCVKIGGGDEKKGFWARRE
ncbi:uncharacterized protein JCM6883_002168 [Sporobolomyces salmoneus]|uniref:uncharacterized protein n=1 Tax=Sporobolomyces salmoneus TaxID=183962 RepID=UPI0031805B91